MSPYWKFDNVMLALPFEADDERLLEELSQADRESKFFTPYGLIPESHLGYVRSSP